MQNHTEQQESVMPTGKHLLILMSGGAIGALCGLHMRAPDESLEIVVFMTLIGLLVGWVLGDLAMSLSDDAS